MTPISKRQRDCFYIYKKQENCETFLYKKIHTLFKKQDSFRYDFIYKNPDTSQKARQFLLHLYTKSQTLYVMRFS